MPASRSVIVVTNLCTGLDILVACFDPGGRPRWARSFGRPRAQIGRDRAADGVGGLYVVGCMEQRLGFDSLQLNSSGGNDIFVASFDATGGHRWSARFGGSGDDSGGAIVPGPGSRVHVLGTFSGTVDLGGGPLTSAGGTDVFVLELAQ